jgi:putative spermidine/putrescine transport system permease protein
MTLPPYVGPIGKTWHYGFLTFCGLVFLFLIAPILVIIPLSFNAEPYFTFTEGMLAFEPSAYSTRWYEDIVNNPQWLFSAGNSVIVAVFATLLASVLGTIAALGLSQSHMPYRPAIMAVLISPMIVPLIISAAGMYFFYSKIGLAQTMPGLILAHAVLGTPFVVITVTATLVGFDHSLTQASANLGAGPTRTFFKIQMPLILPGVISGGLFAFITSFDEVVVVFFLAGFEQRTIPRQMWAGIREQISPTILAVATVLVCISILLLTTVELLRRRSERLRGMSPG